MRTWREGIAGVMILILAGCVSRSYQTAPPRNTFDFSPSNKKRSRAEAEEAFQRLVVAERERLPDGDAYRAAYEKAREEKEWYSLVLYNAEEDGAAVCEEALRSQDRGKRRAAMDLVSRAVTAEEGGHQYQGLLSIKGQAELEELAVRNIGIFINDANPDIHMLYRLFQVRISMISPPAEKRGSGARHPLLAWYEKHQDLLACDWYEEDEDRRRKIIETWREWAKDNTENFAQDLREYEKLMERLRRKQ